MFAAALEDFPPFAPFPPLRFGARGRVGLARLSNTGSTTKQMPNIHPCGRAERIAMPRATRTAVTRNARMDAHLRQFCLPMIFPAHVLGRRQAKNG